KVAIVTGASRGIGEAITRIYAENGMKVVCAARSKDAGEELAQSIRDGGGDAVFRQTDCSDPKGIKALVDFALKQYGQLDGVVSNAGVGMGGSPVHEYSLDDYDKVMGLNLKGVFAGMKYGAEAIFRSESQGGFLINVASVAGLVPQRGQSLYTATKHAVVGMTKTAALDYAPYNVTANAICPGYTRTSMFDAIPAGAMDYFLQDVPSGRMGKPEECAWLALFLASDMARYITGAAIPIDGALSAGAKNVISWKHPEIRTGVKSVLNADSTIAAIMENRKGVAIVEKHLPGFADNELARAAYGMTFKDLCMLPMFDIPTEQAAALFAELDTLERL
ncbi:SDR family oxidoreductase, partial [Ruminococcaceae bacterium OttesenSCG-928-A11]|nr:SDR family oxidoreductase [Ruminococcaceae bacterium OttesenSCG-928-A11]